MNKLTNIAMVASVILGTASMTAQAENTWKESAHDAWIDGKAESTLLFNTELNSFDINTDVKDGVVVLTGDVESEVDKALAEELVMSLEGVTDVDNQLTVLNNEEPGELAQGMTDSKVTTVVKTRLLFESEVSGIDIDVSTKEGVVTLEGAVKTEAEKQLAINIAKNTNDVVNVVDKIKIIS